MKKYTFAIKTSITSLAFACLMLNSGYAAENGENLDAPRPIPKNNNHTRTVSEVIQGEPPAETKSRPNHYKESSKRHRNWKSNRATHGKGINKQSDEVIELQPNIDESKP